MPSGETAWLHAGGSASTWRRPLLRWAAWLCGLRAGELLSPDQQAQRLQALGYVDVQVQTLDDAVLGGFVRHVRVQEQGHGLQVLQRDWRRVAITARLISACRAAGLGYVLVAGSRERANAAATP